MKFKEILIICILFQAAATSGQNQIKISSNFPGGNIVVDKISKDTVWLRPDLAHIQGNWFYWYFKAKGISGKRITFNFDHDVFAAFGPAYSLNNDHTWKWYGEKRTKGNSFFFDFSEKDTVAFFSVAFPYTERDLFTFLGKVRNRELIKIDTLCFSQQNRMIEKLSINAGNKAKYKVLITARHHACEMMANYVLEGIINSLLNNKNLQFLRENADFMIIPFMDKDGVENGEQGKNRIPRDHNRDYNGTSVHSSTAALRTLVPEWGSNGIMLALDLHCPTLKGSYNECIYLVGLSDQNIEQNQIIFSKLLEKNAFGELRYYHRDFLPFGKSWNTSSNYSKGMSFSKWAGTLDKTSMSTSLEFPYANISGAMVLKDNSRIFGEAVIFSIQEYLRYLK